MKIGVTGSRKGLNERQDATLRGILEMRFEDGAEVHHGCCVGVDERAGEIATVLGYTEVAHPPVNERLMCNRQGDERRRPLPYLERNEIIVSECDLLIAVPQPGTKGGGTLITMRHARKVGTPLIVIREDGTAEEPML